ncbi:uncharacterized protein LOC115925136 [Strongylocentrotus purpuratus]|uniref:P2X purinoreceptor 7 intracellular domain-containing protein n=1 Tax=Strongylocentrotus purpuratus TaxID=7668 RepID=A0A7M7HIX6_STRPU|nr:uncharacterized protein LOC105441926 [Strongylocentrotus purpuratus]XP_030844297.1 uncharacterized protein LOC115925136 [Strongylocentrotus purpuratus]|eukprot:XP_011671876.1 PREDICTED: uncharacterized protein LOC105441926 [Strongylocentrotus purpuratus]
MDYSSSDEEEYNFQRYYLDDMDDVSFHASPQVSSHVASVEEEDIPGPLGLQEQLQTKRKTGGKATGQTGKKAKDKTARKAKGKKGENTTDQADGAAKGKTGGKAKEKKGGKAKGNTGGTAKEKKARKAKGKGKTKAKKFTMGGVTGRRVPSHIAERRAERIAELRTLIAGLTVDRMRDVLLGVVERESGLVLDLLSCPPREELRPSPQPGWCSCGNCRPMQRDIEALCCGLEPENCLSRSQVSIQSRHDRSCH